MSVERISRFGMVNAYLVAEEDGLTLIDTLLLAKDMSLGPGEPQVKLRGGYPGARAAQ